jgi:hypothetical protein
LRKVDKEVLIVWMETVESEVCTLTIVADVVKRSDYGRVVEI